MTGTGRSTSHCGSPPATSIAGAHLRDRDGPILGRIDGPKGGVPLSFRDPDGHVGERATPGSWANY